MAFSTQRDFMNYPPCISTDSAYSDDDVGFGRPTPTSTSASYSTFLQDLTNLWNRLSGRPPTRIRPQGGEERPSIPTPMSSSESDSGVNTEGYQDTTTNRVMPSRYVEPDEPDQTDVISSRDLLDGVEDILLKLETEGKLTIDHVMNLIRKYQDYIKTLLIDGQVPEGGLKKLLEYIEATCEEMSKAIKGLGISEQAKNILMEDVNTLSSAMKTYMCESKRENDAMYQELQKANFDRQSLQISLQKLSNVEDRIVDLKTQAAKAYGMEKEIKDLKDQLEKVKNNNHVLVQRLMQAKTEHNEEEEKHKTDCEKLKIEMQKWKCKAEMLNDVHQRDMLEIEKWKVHCSRLSLELDKATERVLRGHETKRKLYFAESMRCELERQIEEMMTIIKQLTEQKPSLSACPPTKPKDCQNVLSNLLIESKNTLKTILSNVRQDYNTNQSYLDDKCQQQLKRVREENLQLKKEIAELQVEKPGSSKKSYEDQIRKLQEELDKCRSKNNENNTKNEELDQLRKQLEKCQEENTKMRKQLSTSTEDTDATRRLTDENQALKEELEKLQNENSILKDVMNVKGGSTSERDQSSTNQVIVVNLQQSDEGSSNNYSQKTQKSDADHGDGGTEGIIVRPKTETSNLTRSDEFDILSSKLCNCEKALDCLRSQHESHETSEGCSCSGSESSFLSYSSDSEPSFDVQKTLGDMAEVESLLRKKNERIAQLEKQCYNFKEDIVKLKAEKQVQMVQSTNIIRLEKELSKFKDELQEQGSLLQLAKDQLKLQKNDIKDGQKMLVSLQNMNNMLIKENSRLQEEKSARDVVKREKDRHNGSLRNQEIDCEKLEEELAVARHLVEQSRQEFNDKVRGMLEEKDKLEAENSRLTRELQSLDSIVDEVDVERAKNRKMEELIADLESKIESVQSRDPENRLLVEEAKFPLIIASLKQKLEEETNENNRLREQRLLVAKDIDELKKLVTLREREIEKMKQIVNSSKSQLLTNIGSSSDDSREQCIQHINQLKTELDAEKHRYYKLRTKFVNYSKKIECLEEKLRAKRADLEHGIACHPALETMSDRKKGGASNTASTDGDRFEELFKNEKAKNRKLTTKLVVEFIKNEKLTKELKDTENQLTDLTKHANVKRILEIFSDENIELPLVESGHVDLVGIEGAESLTMVQMAHDFQSITDQLKKELQAERQISQNLRTEFDSNRLKTEQLKCKVKKLKTRNTQLRNAIKRREKSIVELQSTIDGLTSITTLEDKEVQTSNHDLKDSGSQLDAQFRKNFELAQDYSKEIATTNSLRNELKQTQRELRKLCKCIEEVEKEKEALQKQNEELKSMLESTKAACTNSTCCNGNCCCKRPQTLSQKIGSELKSGQMQVQKGSSESASAKTNNINAGPSIMKTDNNPKAIGNRIRQICNKIQEAGIGALDPKDLTYLHREVYAAGKRLRISESESTHDKCWEFVTKLPPIPANKEEKIMARVSYLETELDNANQVLQHLKKEYEKESRIDGRERHRGGENNITLPNNLFCEIPSWRMDYHRSF